MVDCRFDLEFWSKFLLQSSNFVTRLCGPLGLFAFFVEFNGLGPVRRPILYRSKFLNSQSFFRFFLDCGYQIAPPLVLSGKGLGWVIRHLTRGRKVAPEHALHRFLLFRRGSRCVLRFVLMGILFLTSGARIKNLWRFLGRLWNVLLPCACGWATSWAQLRAKRGSGASSPYYFCCFFR
jgi:hypothetical protein